MHLRLVIAAGQPARLVVGVQGRQHSAIQLDPQARLARDGQGAILETQLSAHDDIFRLPGIVRVARIGQVGHSRGQVRHRSQRNPHVAVGVHREAATEGPADAPQLHRAAQAAPCVMVAEDDVFGADADAPQQVCKRGGAHVGGQRDLDRGAHRGHVVLSAHRILVVFQNPFQLAAPADRGLHRPDRVGINAQRRLWSKGFAQRQDGSGLDLRRKHAAFQLERLEPEGQTHRLRLCDDAVRVERRGLATGRPTDRGGIGVEAERAARARVLEKEVGGEGNALAHCAAQQVHDRPARGLAHQVETRDLDRAEDQRHLSPVPGCAVRASRPGRPEGLIERLRQRIEMERVAAEDDGSRSLQSGRDLRAAGHFAQAIQTIVRRQLDDRAQRERGVQAGRVEQRRIADGDGGDVHLVDTHGWLVVLRNVRNRDELYSRRLQSVKCAGPLSPPQIVGAGPRACPKQEIASGQTAPLGARGPL